jgi:hypothetical protein
MKNKTIREKIEDKIRDFFNDRTRFKVEDLVDDLVALFEEDKNNLLPRCIDGKSICNRVVHICDYDFAEKCPNRKPIK